MAARPGPAPPRAGPGARATDAGRGPQHVRAGRPSARGRGSRSAAARGSNDEPRMPRGRRMHCVQTKDHRDRTSEYSESVWEGQNPAPGCIAFRLPFVPDERRPTSDPAFAACRCRGREPRSPARRPPGRRAGATKAGRRGGPACGDPRSRLRSVRRRPRARAAPDADRADRAPRHPVRRPPRGYPGAGGRGPAVPHRRTPLLPAPRPPAGDSARAQRALAAHRRRRSHRRELYRL